MVTFVQMPKLGTMGKSARIIILSVFAVFLAFAGFGQSCSFSVTTQLWSTESWSCAGGGTAPITNNGTYTEALTINGLGNGENLVMDVSFTLTGNVTINTTGNPTITIPAGVTVIIIGDFTDANNNLTLSVDGTLIVTGTLKANNNTSLSGTGSISGGTLDLGGGTTGCSGSCPGLSFSSCSSGGSVCASNTTSSTYIWNGSSSSDWQTAANWTPTRTTPATTDVLNFSASGSNRNITNIPTQTIGKMLVTGATSYSFVTAASSKTLTLTSLEGAALQIDNGSTLSVGNGSFAVNLALPSTGLGQIGGQLNLVNGNLSAGGANLELHTNSAPLARTSGQVSVDASTNLRFGTSLFTGGSTITLPDNIFVSAPTIATLTVNRTNGATLGNQSITVSTSATFTLGNLTTNAAGRIRFASTAANPTESTASKIIGYSEMLSRSVTTGALTFLGFNMAAGANNVGNMTLVRRTGASGINTFNASQSIAATWDITATSDPAAGRTISFSWQSAFDNVTSTANRFRTYYFNSGPGWTALGSLQNLAAVGPPRQSASVTTTRLNDTYTLTDETQVLPVELLFFKSVQKQQAVELTWSTASEVNFDYFVIEHAVDAGEFRELARIQGHGTTREKHNYAFVDDRPMAGKNYYRLKETDLDGSISVLGLAVVDVGVEKTIAVFPNPSTDGRLEVKLNFVPQQTGVISVLDMLGKQIIEVEADKDLTRIEHHFEEGTYVLKYQCLDFVSYTKFMVLKH